MRFKFLKKILRIIAIILPCFLFTFVLSSNSFAVSNLSVTLDANNNYSGTGVPIFSSCNDASCLSQYKYLHIDCENCSWSYSNLNLTFRGVNDFRAYIDTYYDLMNSTAIEFRFGLSITNQVWTFELLTDLPSNCAPSPSGTLSITSNGTYNVTNYETAVVDVPPEVIQGDYHDDLVSISHSLILIPAVGLVIYFFFAIYRLLIGGF